MRLHKKWSGPLRRVELDPEPPVKSGRPAPAFRLSRSEPKSAAGHAHGPSDSGTRRFSIGSKDRRVQHLRCRPTPDFILAKPPRRRERTACRSCGELTRREMTLSTVRWGHSFLFSPAAKCVCAISSPGVASIGASHNRGNSALGSGARSNRRFVRWSRRACQIRGRRVPAPTGRGAAPICRGPALGGGHRTLVGGAVLPLRANDTTRPIAGPIVCTRRGSGRPPRWIRRAATEPRPQTGAPLIFLRRVARSLVYVACPGLSCQERVFHQPHLMRISFSPPSPAIGGNEEFTRRYPGGQMTAQARAIRIRNGSPTPLSGRAA